MPLLFVYGSLKQGFANEHINTGRRIPGQYRTLEPYGMYLLGLGEVPCIVSPPGHGHRVVGELHEVDESALRRMDALERVGEPEGYERVELVVERFEGSLAAEVRAFAYVKQIASISESMPRIGPLEEYQQEHAARFQWTGAS